ncbi:MAG: AAA family ATPase [Actinomycetota bacterium]|nr:AAA family ATPase [Actinomycetota bacterium]
METENAPESTLDEFSGLTQTGVEEGLSQDALRGLPEGTLTILFTDVVGSTTLGAMSGDEGAREVLRRQEALMRDEFEKFGGREIKTLGDGFMVAFSSARKGVHCAVAIQRALHEARRAEPDGFLPVRMGLNAGEVIRERNDLFGSAVSAAARISAKAEGGEILISDVVKALVGSIPDVDIQEKGLFSLKGFADRFRIHEIVWRAEVDDGFQLGRTPFVGRETERAQLSNLLDSLKERGGGLILIGGEPGVGKTRFAEEILADARQRKFRTLMGRCYEMDSPSPFLPFIELLENAARDVDRNTFRLALGDAAGEIAKVMPQLRSLFDDIPPPLELPPQQERRYLFNSIYEFVVRASSTRPLVVLLDDLHWADEASLLLLEHVAERLSDVPVLVLGTYRDVELDASRPLARAIDSLVRQRLGKRMGLPRLDLRGVETMLERLGGSPPPPSLVGAIYHETDGNAFFVEEVFQHLLEEGRLFDEDGAWRSDLPIEELVVPESVRLVIGRRLERLSPVARKALTVGAVAGKNFDFSVLQAAAEAEADALLDAMDEAESARIVTSQSSGPDVQFSFGHELIRQTLLAGVSLPRRQRLHLKVADALEEKYGDSKPERCMEIAHHYYQAGSAADSAKTISYMTRVGDRAMEAAAFTEALRYYEEAVSLCDQEETRADVLFKLGLAQRSLGLLDEGVQTWREALKLYESHGNLEAVAEITPEIVLQLSWAGRWDEAFEMAAHGLSVLTEQRDRNRARLLALSSVIVSGAGDYDSAEAMLADTESIARETGEPRVMGEYLLARCVHHYLFFENKAAMDAGLKASELLRQAGDLYAVATAIAITMFAAVEYGNLDLVDSLAEELEPMAAKLGHPPALLVLHRCRNFVRSWEGMSLDEWHKFAEEDLVLNENAGLPWAGHSYSFLARAPLQRGDWPEAERYLELGVEKEPSGHMAGWAKAWYFTSCVYAGKRDKALTLLKELRPLMPVQGKPNTTGAWSVLFCAIEGMELLDLHSEVGALYPIAQEGLELGPIRYDGRPLAMVAGMAAAGRGDWEVAASHFEDALDVCEQLNSLEGRADVLHFYGRMLIRRGPDYYDKARAMIEEAIERLGISECFLSQKVARQSLAAAVPEEAAS